jgi:hypothetical protein
MTEKEKRPTDARQAVQSKKDGLAFQMISRNLNVREFAATGRLIQKKSAMTPIWASKMDALSVRLINTLNVSKRSGLHLMSAILKSLLRSRSAILTRFSSNSLNLFRR